MISKGLRLAAAPLLAVIGLGAWGYAARDPTAAVPDNWGLNAKPHVDGEPFEAFAVLPIIAVVFSIVLALAPVLDRRGDNLRRSEKAYLTTWTSIVYFLALIQGAVTLRATGLWRGNDYGPLLPVWAVGLSFLVVALGNILGKARPNWFIGFRTPWTMSSERTWDLTHRFAGRLFVLTGVFCLLVAVASSANGAMLAMTFGLLTATLVSVLYSYLAWRKAPDRGSGGEGTGVGGAVNTSKRNGQ